MTRHLIRLMWNRKRQNMLLIVEMLVAFLVVVAVSVTALHTTYNAARPLGFVPDDVWTLDVGRGVGRSVTLPDQQERDRETFRQIMAEVNAHPAVERASGAFTGPYRWYSWSWDLNLENRPSMLVGVNRADDQFAEALGIGLTHGRWFTREDDVIQASNREPVVINRKLAMDIFGREDVVGEVIPEVELKQTSGEGGTGANRIVARSKQIVGVIDDFRQFGEISTPSPVLFYRRTIDAPEGFLELPDIVLMKMRPGTTAAAEEALLRRLRSLAPTWSFGVQPLSVLRESMLREHAVHIAILTIVGGAMMLMVALGLTGVVWQSVTQRMREFGLRRAQGATGLGVGRQVVAELVVLASFAMVGGGLLLLQIPLLPLPREAMVVPRPVFLAGVVLAVVAVYFVTILCAWYPSRLAARVAPADALRYE